MRESVAVGGRAETFWRGAQRFPTRAFVESVDIGVDRRGAAIMVWSTLSRSVHGRSDVWMATAPVGGRFGAPRMLIGGGCAAHVAVQPDGRTLLTASVGCERAPRTAPVVLVGGVDGTFAARRTLAVRGGPQLVAKRHGGALTFFGDNGYELHARLISADGRLGAVEQDIPTTTAPPTDQGPDGTIALVTYSASGPVVWIRSPVGRWRMRIVPLGRHSSSSYGIAVSPDGTVAVAASTSIQTFNGSHSTLRVAELRPGAKTFRLSAAPVRQIGRRHTLYVHDPDIAYDDHGRRVVTWTEDYHFHVHPETSRAVAWAGGRRLLLRQRSYAYTLHPVRGGVLALQGGPCHMLIIRGTRVRPIAPPAQGGRCAGFDDTSRSSNHVAYIWANGNYRAPVYAALGRAHPRESR